MNIPQSKLFSALSNSIRLRCLYLISNIDEVCVCDIVEALRITQPTASKALNCLKDAGLISGRKAANWTYYSANSEMSDWKRRIFDATVSELGESKEIQRDEKRMRKLVSKRCCLRNG